MKIKKILATILAASMTLGMATTAFAAENPAEGGATGTGDVEFVYNANVFRVALPTEPENDTTYNFTLDPLGAIEDTQGAGLDGEVSNYGSVYFANVGEEGVVTYSQTSDAKTIVNKSTFEVTVSIEATVEGIDGVTLAASDELTDEGEDAELYLALIGAGEDLTVLEESTTTEFTLAGDPANYEVKYEDGEYSYELKVGADFTDGTANLQLTGACNNSVAWAELGELAPTVEIIWSVAPTDDTLEVDARDDYNPVVEYTVTYDLNGKEGGVAPEAQTVAEGDTATDPEYDGAGVEGFVFEGWYTEPECENKFEFETAITENKTLYANWVPAGPVAPVIADVEIDADDVSAKSIAIPVTLNDGVKIASFKYTLEDGTVKTVSSTYRKLNAETGVITLTYSSFFTAIQTEGTIEIEVIFEDAEGVELDPVTFTVTLNS